MQNLVVLAPILGVLGGVLAGGIFLYVKRQPVGTPTMEEIADIIHEGTRVFLRRNRLYLSVVIVVVSMLLGLVKHVSWWTSIAFICGAVSSLIAGYIGINVATRTNVRTAAAANTEGLRKALLTAFSGGSVMGMIVASLGVFGVGVFFLLFGNPERASIITGFALGASAIALFLRMGGGIYTKSADVGADLLEKIEVGIPAHALRNPAVIADQVGDNVGGTVGMGTDVFASYVGAVVATIAIGVAMSAPDKLAYMAYPLLVVMGGLIASGVGVLSMYYFNDTVHPQQTVLRYAVFVGAGLMLLAALGLSNMLGLPLGVFLGVLAGCLTGIMIEWMTEYYTTGTPIMRIAEACKTGPATAIITGLAAGMESVGLPVLLICGTIFTAYKGAGVYGLGIAAVGMLATVGVTMSVNAYGPIAENAAEISVISGLESDARTITNELDVIGKTATAMGKGLAIGSSALTALALFAAYSQTVNFLKARFANISVADLPTAERITISLTNANVLIGLLLGGVIPFFISAVTIRAVGKVALKMVEEVRRQFREIQGLMEGNAKPDVPRCVDLTTTAASKAILFPGLLVVVTPILVGRWLGADALGGLLCGAIVSGVLLAFMMTNSGGAWEKSKAYIENGHLGGQKSDVYHAAMVGDIVGDPLKDTAGPSITVIIRIMAVIALVLAPMFVK